jgi:flagellar biosynthesis regulator FlaF
VSHARYAATQATAEHPREAEIRAFAAVARELEAAGSARAARVAALHRNMRLWSVLQADLLHQGNHLPQQLKGMLVSLAIYTQKASMAAMDDDRPLESLAELNRDMAEGLSAQRRARP